MKPIILPIEFHLTDDDYGSYYLDNRLFMRFFSKFWRAPVSIGSADIHLHYYIGDFIFDNRYVKKCFYIGRETIKDIVVGVALLNNKILIQTKDHYTGNVIQLSKPAPDWVVKKYGVVK